MNHKNARTTPSSVRHRPYGTTLLSTTVVCMCTCSLLPLSTIRFLPTDWKYSNVVVRFFELSTHCSFLVLSTVLVPPLIRSALIQTANNPPRRYYVQTPCGQHLTQNFVGPSQVSTHLLPARSPQSDNGNNGRSLRISSSQGNSWKTWGVSNNTESFIDQQNHASTNN